MEKTRIDYENEQQVQESVVAAFRRFEGERLLKRMERFPMELKEWWGVLPERPSGAVNFCNADLRHAELENAVLDWADFSYSLGIPESTAA